MSQLNAAIDFIASKKRTVFAFLLLVNLPLIVFTWNTGNFSDDYQFLNLFLTKLSISPFSRVVLDILEPRTDGHFIPVFYFINTIIYKIYPSPQFFHFIILLCHIGTACMVFMIVMDTHQDRKVALLSGVLFSLSYCVCFKALAWNCFHSHVTDTLTGVIALHFALQYFKHKRRIYLLYVFLFILLTLHNIESGFAWPVVLGVFALLELLRRRVSLQVGLGLIVIVMLAVSVYGLGTFCFTGKAFPIFLNRTQNIDKLKEKLIDLREQDPDYKGHVADDSNEEKSLQTNEMRSTYAPRTLSVLVVRTGDLMMRLVNLSIVESRFRTYFKSYMQDNLTTVQERWLFKQKIKRIAKYVFVVIGLSALIVVPFLIYFIIRNIRSETYPYLCVFITLFIVFVFVFNRIDIANSIAIFSSVFLSDLIFKLVSKGKQFKKIGLVLLIFLLFMALVNIPNGFNDVYQSAFQPKKYLRLHHRVFQDINRAIGHYTENAIVFHPFVRNHYWIDGGDLRSLNIRMFQEDFMETELAKTYSSRSWDDFSGDMVSKIRSIETVTVNTEADAIKHIVSNVRMGEKVDYVYVDKDLNVKRLQFDIESLR